jgi:DNA modification methylase
MPRKKPAPKTTRQRSVKALPAPKSEISYKHQLKSNSIYCGDNLKMLREIPDESIDLIYIDPPFNSNRDYEVFWGDSQEKRAFNDRFGAARAYTDYMRPRVQELYRVLKKTGSFYYHCDWHADSYVRVLLDEIFGANFFRTHIIWKRTNSKGLSFKSFSNNHDSIFLYTKSENFTFNRIYKPHSKEYVEEFFKYIDHATGRRYSLGDLVNPNRDRPNLTYEFLGVKRVWRWTKERMKKAYDDGLIVQTKPGTVPRLKRFLDEQEGVPIDSVWDDIKPVQSQALERIGYPTQKPVPLLDRILQASSNPGDIVLDAFCGCGTTLVAAQKSNRKWIGIDISPTACRVMSQRMWDIFKLDEGKDFIILDLQKSPEELRKLPHFEFQNWACIALGGIPNKRKSGDFGIDGKVYPIEFEKRKKQGKSLFGDLDAYYPIQVKQVDKAGRPDIDSFETAIRRDGRSKGYFIAFDFSKEALNEIKRLDKEGEIEIVPITVNRLLQIESYIQTKAS